MSGRALIRNGVRILDEEDDFEEEEEEVEAPAKLAPTYEIPGRFITALEHPMILENLENGLKTLGRGNPYAKIIDSTHVDDCVPLYLRFNDPMCAPILSTNSQTRDLLLKITVPKRTGRKRKRGSQDPYISVDDAVSTSSATSVDNLLSHSRSDDPADILRKIEDNIGKYTLEPVGLIKNTHRFRGMADFHQSVSNTEFWPKYRDTALSMNMAKIRQFQFSPKRGIKDNTELMPPPSFSTQNLPFNWGWHQNPNISKSMDPETGEMQLINRAKQQKYGVKYLAADVPDADIPDSLPDDYPPMDDDARIKQMVSEMEVAFEERPIWTRRALQNRLNDSDFLFILKKALQYVGYQFKGGPWRDAVIKYGIDPRKDPQYRKYQTFFFKLYEEEAERAPGMQWHDLRYSYSSVKKDGGDIHSHIFNGTTVTLDGKVWQACDITDPILAKLVEEAPYRETFDPVDGWFTNGSIAKLKAIMRIKLIAIRCNRPLSDDLFAETLAFADIVPDRASTSLSLPLPDVTLTEAEMEKMKKNGRPSAVLGSGIRRRDQKGKARNARIRNGPVGEENKIKRKKPRTKEEIAEDERLRKERGGKKRSVKGKVNVVPGVITGSVEKQIGTLGAEHPEMNSVIDPDLLDGRHSPSFMDTDASTSIHGEYDNGHRPEAKGGNEGGSNGPESDEDDDGEAEDGFQDEGDGYETDVVDYRTMGPPPRRIGDFML